MSDEKSVSALAALKADFGRMSLKDLLGEVRKRFAQDGVSTLSAAFAYYWVFAIQPLLILIVMVAALINRATDVQVVDQLRDLIIERAPADSRELLLKLVDNAVAKVSGGLASIGVIITTLIALWSASNAVSILVTGFNRAYQVTDDEGFVRKKLRLLGLTLALVIFVNFAFALLIFGKRIGDWIADWLGLGSAFDLVWGISRWPIAILGIALMLALLYWAGPNIDLKFRWATVGSLLATIAWLVLVAGFGLYLSVANPGSAYGVVGSVIVLLVFLNLTGLIFFMGAIANAILYQVVEGKPVPSIEGPDMVVANQ